MANETEVQDRLRHKMVLCVPKNRDGAVFTFRQIMDVECGKFYEDVDDNDPATKNLEKQANQMMSEGEDFRSEIDIKEIQQAKKEHYDKQIEKLQAEMESSNNEEDFSDEIIEDFSDIVTGEDKSEITIDEDEIINEEKKDVFLDDVSSDIEKPTWESYNNAFNSIVESSASDFVESAPDYQKNEQDAPEVPKNENINVSSTISENINNEKKLSDTIPHKKSANEIFAKMKKDKLK